MHGPTRRDFLRSSGAGVGLALGGGLGLSGCASTTGDLAPKSGRRVVVIGGGWGGSTAARYIRIADPSIEVVLVEPNREFVSCPFSKLVLSGQRTIESLTLSYNGLRARGVKIIHETATVVEPDTRRVRIGEGYLSYDRLVVSPGIDFLWDQVEGLAAARDTILHAWKAGPQTLQLAAQIQSMPDGGAFVLTAPPTASTETAPRRSSSSGWTRSPRTSPRRSACPPPSAPRPRLPRGARRPRPSA